MKKKTLKIFINSFAVSLFAIWTANELLVPETSLGVSNEVPEKNISLFFLGEDNPYSGIHAQTIKKSTLSTIAKKDANHIEIDDNLFTWEEAKGAGQENDENTELLSEDFIPIIYSNNIITKTDTSKKIASIESIAPKTDINEAEKAIEAIVSELDITSDEQVELANITQDLVIEDTYNENDILEQEIAQSGDQILQAEAAIPLEESSWIAVDNDVDITDFAPDTQVATTQKNIELSASNISIDAQTPASESWVQMSETTQTDNPWDIAEGPKHRKNNNDLDNNSYSDDQKNKIVADLSPQRIQQSGSVQVADMAKNILIPIPDDIMNSKNLTPKLVSTKKQEDDGQAEVDKEGADVVSFEKAGGKEESADKPGIFKSIASIFASPEDDLVVTGAKKKSSSKNVKNKIKSIFSGLSASKDENEEKILPTEMKLSFQPGRAEISGQTLRWIEAFAITASKDYDIFLEVRIGKTQSLKLQDKRLNLLYHILTSKGVSPRKIKIVLTSREPNSFIIRTFKINNELNQDTKEETDIERMYYQRW